VPTIFFETVTATHLPNSGGTCQQFFQIYDEELRLLVAAPRLVLTRDWYEAQRPFGEGGDRKTRVHAKVGSDDRCSLSHFAVVTRAVYVIENARGDSD
jgi:hypothetical protein